MEKNNLNQSFSQKKVLNLLEVSAYTGLSLSHLYKLTSQKEIPHSKPNGKKIFIAREELEKWLLRNRISTIEEIEKQASNYLTSKSTTL